MTNPKRADFVSEIAMETSNDGQNQYIVIENELFNTPLGDAITGPRFISFAYTTEQAKDLIEHLSKGLNRIAETN